MAHKHPNKIMGKILETARNYVTYDEICKRAKLTLNMADEYLDKLIKMNLLSFDEGTNKYHTTKLGEEEVPNFFGKPTIAEELQSCA